MFTFKSLLNLFKFSEYSIDYFTFISEHKKTEINLSVICILKMCDLQAQPTNHNQSYTEENPSPLIWQNGQQINNVE